MTPTVFFSWQSDSPKEFNTEFIKSALEEAVKEYAVVESPLRVDSAADGEAGTPDIPSVIFEKLTETAVAVFDVTPVAKTEKGRALSNPNVLLELGFAASVVGWERVVLVLNTGSGFKPEDMPFDLRHRRFPLSYQMPSGNGRQEWTKLCLSFKEYLACALATTHRAMERGRRRLTKNCPFFIEQFGAAPFFGWPHREYEAELYRLVDLGFLRYDLDPAQDLYSYHWTYLGSELCKWYFKQKEIPKEIMSAEHVNEVATMLKSD